MLQAAGNRTCCLQTVRSRRLCGLRETPCFPCLLSSSSNVELNNRVGQAGIRGLRMMAAPSWRSPSDAEQTSVERDPPAVEGHDSTELPPRQDAALNKEIFKIALPMLAALAADPVAGLVDTAFIGRTGAVELAGMAVALSIFNTIAKFMNVPIVSATTTSVAEAMGLAEAAARKAATNSNGTPSPDGNAQPPLPDMEEAHPLLKAHNSSNSSETASSPPTAVGTVINSVADVSVSNSTTEVRPTAAAAQSGHPVPEPVKPVTEVELVVVDGRAGDETFDEQRLLAGVQSSTSPHTDLAESTSGLAGVVGLKPNEIVSSAASAALTMALLVGLVEAVLVLSAGSSAVRVWGLALGTPAHDAATRFLFVRAWTVPFTVVFLALQGVFRGLADTTTPLKASLASNIINITLAPLFIFVFGWGVRGAAAAQGLAQVFPTMYLLYVLRRRLEVTWVGPAAMRSLVALLKPSGFLLLRTASVTSTYAFATSTMAHLGAAYAAAHQVAIGMWLATSLLADALAVAAQSLIARYSAEGEPKLARIVADRCLLMGGMLGLLLGVVLGLVRGPVAHVFTNDPGVLTVVTDDGVLFGVGGFRYASVAMAACSSVALFMIGMGKAAHTPHATILWVWAGLTMLMLMRSLTIYIPYKMHWGPFKSLAIPGEAPFDWIKRGIHRLKQVRQRS